MRIVLLILTLVLAATPTRGAEKGPLWTHPAARVAPELPMGPFTLLNDGRVLTVEEGHAAITADDGKTWERHPLFAEPDRFKLCPERQVIQTRSGVVILVFSNCAERVWEWNDERVDASPATRLPAYATRSLDGGRTWAEPVRLHENWTGATRSILQASNGDVVVSTMMMLHDPGRHATVTYTSSDDGETWQRSNVIDLGGAGHHDGALEATITELRDGRLWMLIRTNEDRFWQAFSADQGRHWRVLMPSDIDASAAPGFLLRLKSGKLLLAWNRLYPEGRDSFPRLFSPEEGKAYMGSKDPRQWSRSNPINHREELSVALSDDDGRTWSKPVVVARQTGAWLSYPYVLERRPGELWITTMQGGLRLVMNEADLTSGERAVFAVKPWNPR